MESYGISNTKEKLRTKIILNFVIMYLIVEILRYLETYFLFGCILSTFLGYT